MKLGLIVVLVLLASAFAAHFLLSDPGYVVISFRGYVVEMSVPVLAGLAMALVFIVWLIRKIIVAPRRLGEAAGRYRAARSGEKLTKYYRDHKQNGNRMMAEITDLERRWEAGQNKMLALRFELKSELTRDEWERVFSRQ